MINKAQGIGKDGSDGSEPWTDTKVDDEVVETRGVREDSLSLSSSVNE